jgi:hypothetical protein
VGSDGGQHLDNDDGLDSDESGLEPSRRADVVDGARNLRPMAHRVEPLHAASSLTAETKGVEWDQRR